MLFHFNFAFWYNLIFKFCNMPINVKEMIQMQERLDAPFFINNA